MNYAAVSWNAYYHCVGGAVNGGWGDLVSLCWVDKETEATNFNLFLCAYKEIIKHFTSPPPVAQMLQKFC